MKFFIILGLSAVAIATPVSQFDWSTASFPEVLPKDLQFVPNTKGDLDNGLVSRIVGGAVAPRSAFPYQVGLLMFVPGGNTICGGSLLNEKFVITAAHCLDSASKVIVFLGANDLQNQHESGQARIQVERNNFIIHKEWDATHVINDIALIELPMPVQFSSHIQPVRLPTIQEVNKSFQGFFATASGWGRSSDGAEGPSTILRYVELPIISNQKCMQHFAANVRLTNICTGGANKKSTCNGDSGGPLVVEDEEGHPTIVGIVSFGYRYGCEVGWPAVYTRVTAYLDWISKATGVSIQ